MASNTSAAFIEALRAELVTAVAAHGSYDDVSVVIVPDGTTGLEEAVSLIRPPRTSEELKNPAGRATGTQEWAALGTSNRRKDSFTIESSLWVKKTGKADAASSTFKQAMDRAAALLDIVITQIRDKAIAGGALDVGDQTIQARVSRYEYRPARIDDGWAVICDFDISVDVRVT